MALRTRLGISPVLIVTLGLGTILNPLNSSMIAVALVGLEGSFDVGVATASWLVSGFYVTAAVGQPLMGRLVDQFGARRMFVSGLALVLLGSLLAPFVPGFWWLVAIRVLQGVGSSAAYPSALVLIRAATEGKSAPAGALGAISVANSTSAALGPVLGGFLVAFAGWEAVFLVNAPVTIAGIVMALLFLPRNHVRHSGPVVSKLDLPGVALFGAALTTLLIFLLSFADNPQWILLPVSVAVGGVFVWWERRAAIPFLDLRALAANRALSSVLVQQGAVNFAFYCMFFSMPLWLESVRGFDTNVVGLMILPIATLGVITTPVAAAVISRRGSRPALVFGSIVLVIASLLVQTLGDTTPVLFFVAVAVLLGVPNGFNNLGLQTALYESATPERTGSAGGLFQTFRYLGAILSTSVLGVVFERDLTSRGLHHVGYVMTGAALLVLTLAVLLRRPVRSAPQKVAESGGG